MKVLHLTLKAKWYDLIASGEKREEYRDIKPYWRKRLLFLLDEGDTIIYKPSKHFHAVRFARGGHFHPSIPQILVKCEGIEVGEGKADWGAAPGVKYYVIKLGEIIK